MNSKEHTEPTNWREGRRLRAWELFQQGWTQARIAEALGVTSGAVCQWLQRARAGGRSALQHRKPPGKVSRLTPAQQAQAPDLLRRGPTAWGFQGERWTRARVAAMLQQEFGVYYHPAHVSRLLRQWGWTQQKPTRRARQQDAGKVQEWREKTWPTLEKKGAKPGERRSL